LELRSSWTHGGKSQPEKRETTRNTSGSMGEQNDMAGDLFSESIKLVWEKNEAFLKEMVEQRNIPAAWQWFEYLYNEMQKREQRLQQTQQ